MNRRSGKALWAGLITTLLMLLSISVTIRDKGEHISPRLLFMLDYFSDLVARGSTITLKSGYRSPEYNLKLLNEGGIVAKTSLHMDGMAMDFSIQGVDGKKLWDLIRSKECCGAGHYGDDLEGLCALHTARIGIGEENGCRMIEDRKASRFLYVIIPSDLPAGRYRIRVDFCRQPFPQMPLKRISNEIEIL